VETDLERMYRAGKDYIPNAADLLGIFDTQSALAGDPSVLRNMLMVGGDTYDVLRGGVDNLYHCAEAVVRTADDFRATDQRAADDYAHMDRKVRDLPAPVEKPAPPSLGNPEDPGSAGTPSTPDPQDPDDEREDRDHPVDDPTANWGV
jgi:hypothetical protein